MRPEERSLQLDLKARNERTLAAIQDRLHKAVAYHGRLSAQALGRLSAAMTQGGAQDALIEERTGDKQSSTLVVLFSKAATPPKLAVNIPLRANGTAPVPSP